MVTVDQNNPYYKLSHDPENKFHLPLDFSKDNERTIYGNLKKIFEKYQSWISNNVQCFDEFWKSIGLDTDKVVPFISELSEMLLSVLNKCLHGKRFFAMEEFGGFVKKYDNLFLEDNENPENGGFFHWCSLSISDNTYYRIRKDETLSISGRPEMFHVPYSMRYLNKTYRFSVEGIPGLYLSESLFSCWKELGSPELNQCTVSKFEINPKESNLVKGLDSYLINLAFDFRFVEVFRRQFLEDNQLRPYSDPRCIAYQLLMRPLVMSCNVKKKNEGFVEEYLISNIFFEFLNERYCVSSKKLEDGLVGVRYYSTHKHDVEDFFDFSYKEVINYEAKFVNYAFVASPEDTIVPENQAEYRGNLEKCYSPKLLEACKLTKPISWNEFRTVKKNVDNDTELKNEIDSFEDYVISNYENTEFGRLEKFLDKMKCCKLTD